jgi:RNA chaperone Hfq
MGGVKQAKPEHEAKPEVKPSEKPKPKPKPKLLDDLKGRRVVVFLRNGYSIEGVVGEISKFEVLIDDGSKKYVVLKHAIDYIVPS